MARSLVTLATLMAALACPRSRAEDSPQYAGPTSSGFLLPNGWRLSPAGQHVVLTDLPLNILPTADGKRVLVATSGYNRHELSLIDLTTRAILSSEPVGQSWF